MGGQQTDPDDCSTLQSEPNGAYVGALAAPARLGSKYEINEYLKIRFTFVDLRVEAEARSKPNRG